MKRHRIIVSTFALLAGLCLGVPTALASGPLLSGYGGPGAGDQTILGGTLLAAPKGGSGAGGGSGNSSPGGGESAATSSSLAVASSSEARRANRAHSGSPRGAGSPTGTHPRAEGANPNPNTAHLGASAAVSEGDAGGSWFSSTDLLALVLVAGVLAIVAVATARLARTGTDEDPRRDAAIET